MKKRESNNTCFLCTRSQRIWAAFALGGLFLCGMMVGFSIWGDSNRLGRNAEVAQVRKGGLRRIHDILQKRKNSCEMREEALLQRVNIGEQLSEGDHHENARIYALLVSQGCQENQEKFRELAIDEESVASALRATYVSEPIRACETIEQTLLERVRDCEYNHGSRNGADVNVLKNECYTRNAEIYISLMEKGCPENAQNYKQMAYNQLQIADGVVADSGIDENVVRERVDVYKKLQMRNEAKKYLQKAERLINPGVDFIMELQHIIEE